MADDDSLSRAQTFSPDIFRWVDKVHAPHDAGLEAAYTASQRTGIPNIHVGAEEGKLLEVLMRLISPQKVVEIGTLAGYSAIRLARGLAAGGRVYTIEFEAKHAAIARENIRLSGLSDRIEVLEGDARRVLAELASKGPFDVVFVDADKVSYDFYEQWAAKNLRKGGLFIADNAFLFGELLTDSDAARAMRACHEQSTKDFESVCIPTPDGMILGIKR
jgi:caffeoyl-CoA O-methyltransferase